jgi:hypothetical protein
MGMPPSRSQDGPNVAGGQVPERDIADAANDGLKDVPVEPDGLRDSAVQAFTQPVLCRLAYGVAAGGPLDPGLDVAVKLGELVPDFLLRTASHLSPQALAVWAVTLATPHPATGQGIPYAACHGNPRVVEVDRVLAETAPAHARSVTLWLPDDLHKIAMSL